MLALLILQELVLYKNVSNSNDDVSGLIIEGNILAENQGNISLDIGNNSLITGNINDYSYLADLNN